MNALESLLLWANALPVPGAWLPLQLCAVLTAIFCFFYQSPDPKLRGCLLLALPFGLFGAFLLGALFRWIDYLFFDGPAHFAGVAAFGALSGVALAFGILAKRRGFVVSGALDRLAVPLLCLVGVGRLGCFLGGCDAGVVSGSALAVRFPAGTQTFRHHVAQGLVLRGDTWSLSVHPAQLYEAVLVLLLAMGLILARHSRKFSDGAVFLVAMVGYAIVRAEVDMVRPAQQLMTYGQWSAAAVLVASLVWLLVSANRPTSMSGYR